jgi:hypothetical protein
MSIPAPADASHPRQALLARGPAAWTVRPPTLQPLFSPRCQGQETGFARNEQIVKAGIEAAGLEPV